LKSGVITRPRGLDKPVKTAVLLPLPSSTFHSVPDA
jgi:hypothetical protein